MFTAFNSESLWIGTDLKRFNEIRDVLDRENIKYKYKVKDQLGEWTGSGTLRGRVGSAGNPAEQAKQYEILGDKKNLEQSIQLCRTLSDRTFRNNIILFIRHQNLRECSKRIWCLFYAAKIEINFI